MTNKKIEAAIQYILRHPVQFGAKYSDRCILADNIQFRLDFENYIKAQSTTQTKISLRKFAQILWEYYTLWLNRPHDDTNVKEYQSVQKLQHILDDLLQNTIDYVRNKPEEFYGADNHAIDTIRTNKNFRKYVQNQIESALDKYENLSQRKSAEFIWRLYEDWAY